ncbi:MAG: hypothetical protein JHC93_04380 [Parachlamydiales bacterium]|nr:hypothetical protein [Parachlamydiales bacterium]
MIASARSATNYERLATWVKKGGKLELNGNQLKHKSGFKSFFKNHYLPFYKTYNAKRVLKFLNEELKTKTDKNIAKLSAQIIKINSNNKSLRPLLKEVDEKIGKIRADLNKKQIYLTKDNQNNYNKWKDSYHFEPRLFSHHIDFAKFLFDTHLASQIKATKTAPKEIDGEAALLVEGEWIKFSDFSQRFSVRTYGPTKEKLIADKTNAVYSYLDNEKGFELTHPYTQEKIKPLTKLSQEEFQKTLTEARKFKRSDECDPIELNKDRHCIIQVVSSEVENKSRFDFISGPAKKQFSSSKHPWLRWIDKEGNVFDVGYGSFIKQSPKNLLKAIDGKFRSPDLWNFLPCDSHVVTNIAATEDEILKLSQYAHKYKNDDRNFNTKAAFHGLSQNCTAFTTFALMAATGIKIPTVIPVDTLIGKCVPPLFNKIAEQFQKILRPIKKSVLTVMPKFLAKAYRKTADKVTHFLKEIWKVLVSIRLSLLEVMMGGLKDGKNLVQFEPDLEKNPERFKQPLKSGHFKWLKLSHVNIHLPSALQEWQKQQASTVIYKKPTKLCIVP